MLVLSRRTGESLMVGDNIEIKVLGVQGNQIRLGIQAPRELVIRREEIYEPLSFPKKSA